MHILEVIYVIFLLFMLIQGIVTIYLTLYIWESPERLDLVASPQVFENPNKSFTLLLPARHEESVIAETIYRLSKINYPKELLEILLVCDQGDKKTLDAAKQLIIKYTIRNAKVVTFSDFPINKPHGLNVGLSVARGEIVVVFDAEDNVHPDILNIANTIYIREKADIIQAGVQLMNYHSRWFSAHNVLEYYFWFRSRMHFHTRVGVVPLGGNTVFFKRDQLIKAGGWNENCLTEDAEIGIRMSVAGAKIVSTYDARHITKEETPATIGQFIKQRTRWNQGFLQILGYKYWRRYGNIFQIIFCFYTLAFPFAQCLMFLVAPIALYIGLTVDMPVVAALLSFIPILLVLVQLSVNVIGLHEFIKEQKLAHRGHIYPLMIITFGLYQILLSIGALRATYRQIIGKKNWEKTAHSGLHRREIARLEV